MPVLRRAATPDALFLLPRLRRGRVGFILLALLLLLMFFGAFVLDSFYVTAARAQQENASDAAALAAAETLATEALLYGDPSLYTLAPATLFAAAAQSAHHIGAKNRVSGRAFKITAADVSFDIMNIPSRAIVGSRSAKAGKASSLTLSQLRSVNAVKVVGRSTRARANALKLPAFDPKGYQMVTQSVAVLDGYVYGFSPYVSGLDPTAGPPLQTVVKPNLILEGLNIPLVPLAILSDPTGTNPQSWEYQVESGVDRASTTALAYGTMTLTLGNAGLSAAQQFDAGTVNAAFLAIGTNYAASPPSKYSSDGTNRTIDAQILNGSGITPADYYSFYTGNGNMPFALNIATDPPGPFSCPGTPVGPDPATADFAELQTSLASLQNMPMVWPLFSGYDNSTPPRVLVSGFVVARVSAVAPVTVDGQSCLQVELTPSLRATKTALTYGHHWPTTQPAPSAFFPFRFPNAYVKRIRLMR